MIQHIPHIEVDLTPSGKDWYAPGVIALAHAEIDGEEHGPFMMIRTPTDCIEAHFVFPIGDGPPPAFLSNEATVRLLQRRIGEAIAEHERGAS